MNARQKAKKYKKMAEEYKNKANAWDTYLRYSNHFYGVFSSRKYSPIETLKVVKWLDYRVPVDEEEFFKKEMAMELAEALLREGYIDFKATEDYGRPIMVRKITATLNVTKGGWNDDNY